MIRKIIALIKAHKVIAGLALVILVGGGYYGYRAVAPSASDQVQYTTATATRGTIVSTVSGSGQINVSDQMDIKPEVSGKLTAVKVAKGDTVKQGDLLFSLDARDAVRAVSDAEVAWESAKEDLDDLIAGADDQEIIAAENALQQAQRDLDKAKKTYDTIEEDGEQDLTDAYEDGYDSVSNAFLKLSDYMEDLQDVMGPDDTQDNIDDYKLILGQSSPFISALVRDFDEADDTYTETFADFREVSKGDDRETIYALIEDTQDTAEAVSQALESARHMFDAISVTSYEQYQISSKIDSWKPQIESDLSAASSTISSLKNALEAIDTATDEKPDKIRDAELDYKAALEKVEDKQDALDDLKADADPLDIKSQRNTVAQRLSTLIDAQESLADHYVRAPFDGVIAEVDAEVGDSVSSGTALATLMTRQQIAELTLNEVDIAKVELGQPATLTFDAIDGLTLTGKVTDIDSIASTSQGVVTYGVTVTLDVANEQIKPGMTTDASIIVDTETDVLYVPNAAVKTQGENSYVEVMTDGKPTRRDVTVGLSSDDSTEIVSGLDEGEEVVTATLGGGSSSSSGSTSGGEVRAGSFGGPNVMYRMR